MNKYLIFIFCFIVATPSFGQEENELQRHHDEGVALYKKSDYKGAAQKWEKGLQIARESTNKAAMALFLNNLGLVYSIFGDFRKALTYHEQALKIDREIGDRMGEGNTLSDIGNVYIGLNDFPKALIYFKEALKINSEIGERIGEGRDLNNIGVIYRNLDDYPKALTYHEEALKIEREIGDRMGEGATLSKIGNVYIDLGDFHKAFTYFEEALKIKREIDDRMGEGRDLSKIGNVYIDLGDLPKALTYYEEALKIEREIGDRMGEGATLSKIGNVYIDLGDFTKALTYHEEALKIEREIGDRMGEGATLNNIGIVYNGLGDFHKAFFYYEDALKIRKEIGDRKGEGFDLNNIGIVYRDLGDYEKAIAHYEESLKISKEIGVPTDVPELNIADIWLKMGEYEKAEEIYNKLGSYVRFGILNLLKRDYSDALIYFKNSLQYALDNRISTLLFTDHTGLGQTYEFLHIDSLALIHYQQAIDLAETQREGLGENEKSRFLAAEPLFFKRIAPYEGQVRVLMAMEQFSKAFFYSENLKARVLAEAMAKRHGHQEVGMPANWVSYEDSLITTIRGLRREMEALYKTNSMDLYAEKEDHLEYAKTHQNVFIIHLRNTYPEYAAVHYPKPLTTSEVLLKPDEALIAFEITDSTTIVFRLQEDDLQIRRVDVSREALEALVRQYRRYFVGIQNMDQLIGYDPKVGHELYALLFGNLLEDIPEETRLIIVPDEILGILPFETLVIDLPEEETIREGEHGPYPAGVTYLADQHTLSYAQSATSLTLLRTLRKEDARGKYMFVLADPIFNEKDDRIQTYAQRGTKVEMTVASYKAISDWKTLNLCGPSLIQENKEADTAHAVFFNRLPQTTELANQMHRIFGRKTKVLIGQEAREDHVYFSPLSEYRYLTFATHGILDKTIPYIQEPALVLTQVNNPDTCDGFLTMSEVMGLNLQADVVALTACETGLGENVSGEGVMGMGRAFQYAGARNVFVSLWSVAEASSTELTLAFFQHINNGKKPVDAIQFARQEVRQRGYEHPFYWGAFILFGE